MFRGDSFIKEHSIDEESAKLGMEARSILKSIQTEESKLQYSANLTRSDRHYFRARADYYRLSLKRLPTEERLILEPSLARFNEKIIRLELEDGVVEAKPIPFLAQVEKSTFEKTSDRPAEKVFENSIPLSSSMSAPLAEFKTSGALSSQSLDEMISQLSLVQLALSADINAESRRILADGLERVIQRLKSI